MGRKTNVHIFQATNERNLTQENVDMGKKKGNPKRRTESLLIVTQNSALRTMSKQK